MGSGRPVPSCGTGRISPPPQANFALAKFAPKYTHKVLTQSINPQANFAFAKFAVVSNLYFVL